MEHRSLDSQFCTSTKSARVSVLKGVFSLALGLWLAGCVSGGSPSSKNNLHLIVLHTNDVHGHAWAYENENNQLIGGLAAQLSLVNQIRNEAKKSGSEVLVLSGGDVNTGVPESDFAEGKPDIVGMNAIGYDAMVLGNHEFDHGVEKIKLQKSWASFPFLSANIKFPQNGGAIAKPYEIFFKKEVPIGVMGLTTDDLKNLVLPKHTKNLGVESILVAGKRTLRAMKTQGAKILIAATHVGVNRTGSHWRQGLNDDRNLAQTIPEIDLIVGGHSHTALPEGIVEGNTLIVQAGERGRYLGRVDLNWDLDLQKITKKKAVLIPILPEQGEDANLKRTLDGFRSAMSKTMDKVVGETLVALGGSREKTKGKETNLGNWICDVLREHTKTDVAVYNAGGIRASLPAGPIRVRDIFRILPFRNTVVTASLTGTQLLGLLAEGMKQSETLSGGFLQVSGIRIQAQKGEVLRVEIGGKPITPEKHYKISTNSFVAQGGDGHSAFKTIETIRDSGQTIDEVILAYLSKHPRINPRIDGRITNSGSGA